MTKTRYCRVCGDELTDENWYPSFRKRGDRICKYCKREQVRLRRKKNPEKARAMWTRQSRNRGHLPMSENKDSADYLGVYVNERLIRLHFKEIEVFPYGNPGFDFICNKGMKVDAKSACLSNGHWLFNIRRNTEADYFLCVAYDDREHLNIMHVWMIPGHVINHFTGISISPSTIHKWDKYIYDIEGFSSCCNAMKNGNQNQSNQHQKV